MIYAWLELETFLEKQKLESRNDWPLMFVAYCNTQTEMEKIKTKYFEQSLSEAGYF